MIGRRQPRTRTTSAPKLSQALTQAPGRLLQRKCACGGAAASMSGECEECQDKKLRVQRKGVNTAGVAAAVPHIVHEVINSTGQPLDKETRAFIEPRFRHDFSRVRVHADARAGESAQAVNALAYTVGRDVVFGAGQYRPETPAGRAMLAHELTHVVQQRGEVQTGNEPLEIGPPGDIYEREADEMAEQVKRTVGADAATPNDLASRTLQGAPSPAGSLRLSRTPDPIDRATYPSTSEQQQINQVFNPQQPTTTPQGGSAAPSPVTDPNGFRQAMTTLLNNYIGRLLPAAQARQASSMSLDLPLIQSLGDVAQPEVERFYGTYLRAAAATQASAQPGQAAAAPYRLREHLHLVSEKQSEADIIACNWVASRMADRGSQIIEDFHVIASMRAAKNRCSTTASSPASSPAPSQTGTQPAAATATNERDQALFESVRDSIQAAHQSDLRTIILFQSSFRDPNDEIFIQSQIVPEIGESTQNTNRRGRWETFGTVVHEMLHALAHEQFKNAVANVQNSNVGVEGFAEYFARLVYDDVRRRAATDNALRASIEGVQEPFDSSLAPDRTQYQGHVDGVNQIKSALGENDESLKVAFFMGRVEYIGLGGWNPTEARRRERLRYPANTLGVAAMLTGDAHGFFRVDYARVVVGRGERFQFTLGATLNYLTEGQRQEGGMPVPESGRLGVGGMAAVQYLWPNFYIRGSAGIGASTGFDRPFEQTVRLDLIPGAEAGVRIGWARIGAGTNILIPLAGGPVGERVVRAGGLLGLSADF